MKIKYFAIVLFLIFLGLSSRMAPNILPHWYSGYAGDYYWAMMVFFMVCLVFGTSNNKSFALAIFIAYLLELSQLLHFAWLDYIRSFKIGGLLLGYTFLWSDMVLYTIGICTAFLLNKILIKRY